MHYLKGEMQKLFGKKQEDDLPWNVYVLSFMLDQQ
jgi:hypothetical protein